MTLYFSALYGLGVAVTVIISLMIYETILDIRAASQVRNGRLTVAYVRLVREVMLSIMSFALIFIEAMEPRRLAVMSCVLVLALTEVYLRRAIRHRMAIPPSFVRCWELFFGPRE